MSETDKQTVFELASEIDQDVKTLKRLLGDLEDKTWTLRGKLIML